MKTYKYVIAIFVLVILLGVAIGIKSIIAPIAPAAPIMVSPTPSAPVMPAPVATSTKGLNVSVESPIPAPVPVKSTPKITYSTTTVMNDIVITWPTAGATISAGMPLKATGKVRGWFFEGTFPAILVAADGRVIATGHAESVGNWMTSAFVPFTTNITFVKQPAGTRGFLILKKDNPSDMREYDASVEIPVVFE